MSKTKKGAKQSLVPAKQPAYAPNNLDPIDAWARQFDDTSDGIDWDEIIATTEDDFQAGRFSFNSADYPTHEAAMEAMKKWLDDLLQEALREAATVRQRSKGRY